MKAKEFIIEAKYEKDIEDKQKQVFDIIKRDEKKIAKDFKFFLEE